MKSILLSSLCLFLLTATSAAALNSITVKSPGGNVSVISNPYDGYYEFAESGTIFSLETKPNAPLVFKRGGSQLSAGAFKGTKLTMTTPSGSPFVTLKSTSDKIKFTFDASGNEWEFKQKEGKVKIRFDGVEYGKIKFYPDTGKIKAKDKNGTTVTEVKGLSSISAFPGLWLVKNLPVEKRAFLVLLFVSLGR